MKSFVALGLALIISACNGTKSIKEVKSSETKVSEEKEMMNNVTSITLKSGCLPEGECSFEVMENTKIDFKTDSADMLYPEMVDDSATNTVKFTYSEDADKEMMDGHYREEVYFEVKKRTQALDLENMELTNVNFLYGRFCYCKGSAGYFKVENGSVVMKDGNLTINFENGQVPQKLKTITATYK